MERKGSIDHSADGGYVFISGRTAQPIVAKKDDSEATAFAAHTYQHALLTTGGLMSPLNPRPGRNVHTVLVGPNTEAVPQTPLQAVADSVAARSANECTATVFKQVTAAPSRRYTAVAASWSQALLLTSTGDVYQWVVDDGTSTCAGNALQKSELSAVATGPDLGSPRPQLSRGPSNGRASAPMGASASSLGPLLVSALCWERALKTSKIISVSCGPQHCLALSGGPTWDVYSWGHGGDGRLGHGEDRDEVGPRVVTALIPYRVTAISAGGSHSAAVTQGGVECAELEAQERKRLSVKIAAQTGVPLEDALSGPWARQRLAAAILARHRSSLAGDAGLGAVWTWGRGGSGRLGHGSEVGVKEPTRVHGMVRLRHRAQSVYGVGARGPEESSGSVSVPPSVHVLTSLPSSHSGVGRGKGGRVGGADADSIASGHTGQESGSRSGWLGSGLLGQLSGRTAAVPVGSAAPSGATPVGALTPYEEARVGLRVATGGPFTKGTGSGSGSGALLRDRPIVTQIACGRNFTVAVTADGDVWAWGRAGQGQCGVDTRALLAVAGAQSKGPPSSTISCPITASGDLLRPHRIVFPAPQHQHTRADIAAAAYEALKQADAFTAMVSCPWTLRDPLLPIESRVHGGQPLVDAEPRPVGGGRRRGSGGSDVQGDSMPGPAGEEEDDGDRFSTSSSPDGPSAIGLHPWDWATATEASHETSSSFSSHIYEIGDDETRVARVAVGHAHALACSRDGQVWGWGANHFLQVGVGRLNLQVTPPANVPVQLFLRAHADSVRMSAGGNESKEEEGEVAAGRDTYPVVAVAAGAFHSIAITSAGQILTWGANREGQLGCGEISEARGPEVVCPGPELEEGEGQNLVLCPVPQRPWAAVVGLAAGKGFSIVLESDCINPPAQTGSGSGGARAAEPNPRPRLLRSTSDNSAPSTGTSSSAARLALPRSSTALSMSTASVVERERGGRKGAQAVRYGTGRAGRAGTGDSSTIVPWGAGWEDRDGLPYGSLLTDGDTMSLTKVVRLRISRRQVDELRQATCAAEWTSQLEGMAGSWDAFAVSEVRVQSLWRTGVPPHMRVRVWAAAIGNALRVTPALFHMCLDRSNAISRASGLGFLSPVSVPAAPSLGHASLHALPPAPSPVKAIDFDGEGREAAVMEGGAALTTPSKDAPDPALEAVGREASSSLIRMDLLRTFPSTRLFGPPGSHSEGPLYAHVRDVLAATACLRPDLGYVQGMSYLAAAIAMHTAGAAVSAVPVLTTIRQPTTAAPVLGRGALLSASSRQSSAGSGGRSPMQQRYMAALSPPPSNGPVGTGGSFSPGVAGGLGSPSTLQRGVLASLLQYSRSASAITVTASPVLYSLRLASQDKSAVPASLLARDPHGKVAAAYNTSVSPQPVLASGPAVAVGTARPIRIGTNAGGGAETGDLGSPRPGFGFNKVIPAATPAFTANTAPSPALGGAILTVADDRFLTFQILVNLMGKSHLHAFFAMDPGPLSPYYDCFDRTLALARPALSRHLSSCGISAEMFIFGWFQTLFLKALPLPSALRVLDTFLLDGLPHLYRTAIGVLDTLAPYLLGEGSSFEDSVQVLTQAPSKADVWERAVGDPSILADAIDGVELPGECIVEMEDIGGDPFFYRHVAMTMASQAGQIQGGAR